MTAKAMDAMSEVTTPQLVREMRDRLRDAVAAVRSGKLGLHSAAVRYDVDASRIRIALELGGWRVLEDGTLSRVVDRIDLRGKKPRRASTPEKAP